MERSPRKITDKEIAPIFDFIFNNAFGLPIIFDSEPSLSEMKSNTWGKVKDVNTAIYIRFGDSGGIKITGTALS